MTQKISAPDIPDSSSEEPPGREHPLPPPVPDIKPRAFRRDGVAFSMNGTAEAHTVDWSVEIRERDKVMIRSRRLREVFPQSEFTFSPDGRQDRWYDLGLLQKVSQKSPVVLGLLRETESAIAQLLQYHTAVQENRAAERESPAPQVVEGNAGGNGDVQ
ncbi:MAG: hypothetical protein G01um101425_584 [Candidatus Peregrinibacteria bacterium Gr01-1014_25]|nr:MAG: hypothetical protein G01um101425_584 [Candidatus Peregrinibacteria bacterium Gr01-1014_25]